MKNDQLKYGVVGFFLGGAIVWLMLISVINSNNTGMMRMVGMKNTFQSPMRDVNSLDAHFIEEMIPHHEDAITMAKLALNKSSRSEIRQLAQNIIDSQSKEIEQMKNWYKDWYGKDVPQDEEIMSGHGMQVGGNMHMGMMGDETDTLKLENAENFDRAFIEEMIPHHQMAVMMAQMLKNGTQKAEMSKLADDIITAQTQEINKMRTWLKDWGY